MAIEITRAQVQWAMENPREFRALMAKRRKSGGITLVKGIALMALAVVIAYFGWDHFSEWGLMLIGGAPAWWGLWLAVSGGSEVSCASDLLAWHSNQQPSGNLGNAAEASTEEIDAGGLRGDEGIYLGVEHKEGGHIRFNGEGNLVLVAPARTGKFATILGPTILEGGLDKRSCIFIDPKGQIAAVTKRYRETLGRVIVVNPFEVLKEKLGPSDRYNPMDCMDPQSSAFSSDAESIAHGVVTTAESGPELHWSYSAHGLVSGITMQLKAAWLPPMQNLVEMWRLINGPREDLRTFCKEAVASGNPYISSKLSRFADSDPKNANEIECIISAARTQTNFIGTEAIARNLSESTFRFADLRKEITTVYVVLPIEHLETCGKWFRAIVASALKELLVTPKAGEIPVVMVMDEFAQLGRLASIQNAMGLAAGYKLQLWPILQDLTQLKRHYGDAWETFLANADVQQFFAPLDNLTAEYLSKMCGVKTVVSESRSTGSSTNGASGLGSSESVSYGERERSLFMPFETKRISAKESLIFARGVHNVIRAYRAPYYPVEITPEYFQRMSDESRKLVENGYITVFPGFEGLYDPDPYHPKG